MGSRPEVACRVVLILSRADVEALLEPAALLDAVSAGLQALSAGAVPAPPRQAVNADGGAVLTMAGRRAEGPVVVKLVGVFAGNVALGLEPHPAVIWLLDATTGVCLALMDGEHITGLRTAAAPRSPRARSRARMLACSRWSGRASRRARTCGCCRWCGRSRRSAWSRATRARPSGSASRPGRSRART